MTVSFFVMHWLVSQNTFIIRVNKFDCNGNLERGWTTTGYSFIPCFIGKKHFIRIKYFANDNLKTVNLGFLLLIFQIIHGNLRKYPNAMPLAFSCSAAISAACHRPEADKEAHLLPVQWGVVEETTNDRNTKYCSFTTSRDVIAPSVGSFYLGLSSSKEDEY